MAKKKNNTQSKSSEKEKELEVDEFDFSEGFGGIPSDVEFTKNIGCASNSKKKKD